MIIVFLGDSITEGVGASVEKNCYVSLVENIAGVEVYNYGVSGSRIARQKVDRKIMAHDWDFQQRAMIMKKDADFVFVFGGTNDFGHGNADLTNDDIKDPYTFWGGMNNLCDYLLSVYDKERICFLLPLRRFNEINEKGCTLKEYVDIMISVLKEKNIEYLDFYQKGLPQPLTEQNNEYFCDGLHPNDNGHKWIAEQIVKYVKSFDK